LEVGHIDVLQEIGLSQETAKIVEFVRSFVEPLLFYIPRAIPHYTDHGIIHSRNLLRLLSNFIENFRAVRTFSEEEKLLLCQAVWLHDVGCLLGREHHNENSLKILKHNRFTFLEDALGKDLFTCLKYVIVSHSSTYNLRKIPKEPIHHKVNLRLICAVFRLLDGCDVTFSRSRPVLFEILRTYNLIDDKSVPIWEAHINIFSVTFKNNHIFIDYEDPKKSKISIEHLKKDLNEINKIFEKEEFPQLDIKEVFLKLEE